MAHSRRLPIFKVIADLPLYIRSFFSKTAIYKASYIKQEIRSIGSKSAVIIYLSPVFFDEGDEILASQLAGAKIIPESNLIKARFLGDLIYDEENSILFSLDAKLIGKKQRTSLLEIHKNHSVKVKKVVAFLAHLINYDGENVKLGSIRNTPPVAYRNLLCQTITK